MQIIIVFICIPFGYSGFHSFITTYTGIRGATETPEFIAVTTLDGKQIDYYDSKTNELIPKQDWMKEYVSKEMWKEDTKIRQEVHQIYMKNIHELMQRFKQTRGVHVYQRIYGCYWDDETEESHGFDQYGYDGEDYVILDVKERRFFSPIPQGEITAQKWNTNREQLDLLQQYYNHECVDWLKQFLKFMNAALQTRAPKVSLLQKNQSSPVECHATGFYPSVVTVKWFRSGHELLEDVKSGDTLPNEDETFQKSSILDVPPDDWKMDWYFCEVEHMGITTQKHLNEKKINKNIPTNEYLTVMLLSVLVLCLYFFMMPKLKFRFC